MGFCDNYFGHIGEPFKTTFIKFYIMKFLKYRATKVPKGSTICEVIEQAIDDHWMSNNSYNADKLRKKYCNE
jgi:hypothetical protein